MPIPLDEEARRYLAERPGWIALSTVGPDGFPHTVPLGYVVLGDRLYLGCRDGTQKVRNIERNPRVSLMLAAERDGGAQHGLMIQGLAEVLRDPEAVQEVRVAAARQRGEPPRSPVPPPGIAYIQVTPERIRRWVLPGRNR